MKYVTLTLAVVIVACRGGDDDPVDAPAPLDAAVVDACTCPLDAPTDAPLDATVDASPEPVDARRPDAFMPDARRPRRYGTPCNQCDVGLDCYLAVGAIPDDPRSWIGVCSSPCSTADACDPGAVCWKDRGISYPGALCYWPCPCAGAACTCNDVDVFCIEPENSVPVCSPF